MYVPPPHLVVSAERLSKGERRFHFERVSFLGKNIGTLCTLANSCIENEFGLTSLNRGRTRKQRQLGSSLLRDQNLERSHWKDCRVLSTSIVWFRDLFRLDDHPALVAAVEEASQRQYLLPLIIVPVQVNQSPQVTSIVSDLRASLRKRGSDLLVIENGDFERLRWVISKTGAKKVFMTPCRDTCTNFQLNPLLERQVMDVFASSGLSVQLVADNDLNQNSQTKYSTSAEPIPCPLTLPKAPHFCFYKVLPSNDLNGNRATSIDSTCVNETFALRKLDRLLSILSYEDFDCFHSIYSYVCKCLRREVISGVVSKTRIYFELKRRVSETYSSKSHEDVTRWIRVASSSYLCILSFLLFNRNSIAQASSNMITAMAYDVEDSKRLSLEWDESTSRFRLANHDKEVVDWSTSWKTWLTKRVDFLKQSFFPEGVTHDYYSFTMWRVFQRLVSSTVGVFGTQALLLALGIKAGRIGRAAATSWVLKDGLGRLGKMVWASQMGRDFDADPKRWRFRSALLYALGNGLEIVTQIFPASFLLFATLANSMKQISMLTASATRNAMYKNFAGRSENIADITAKGEAQIVVADLLGMALGIQLSKWIGTSRPNVLTAYSFLSVLDIYAIYKELRAVQFRTLNYERSSMIVDYFVRRGYVPRPDEVSQRENIFLAPRYDVRSMFASLSDAVSCPQELNSLVRTFKGEQFMVTRTWDGQYRIVLREHARNSDILRALLTLGFFKEELQQRKRLSWKPSRRIPFLSSFMSRMENDCWWSSLQTTCDERAPKRGTFRSNRQSRVKRSSSSTPEEELLAEKLDAIICSYNKSKECYHHFMDQLHKEGWNTERLLYSPVKKRAVW